MLKIYRKQQRGAAIAEFVVVGLVLFMIMLAIVQYAFISHAKSQVYYATYEAARAASAYDKKKGQSQYSELYKAFERGLIGYYGGGKTQADIDKAQNAMRKDISQAVIIKYENIDDRYVRVKVTFGIPDNKQVFFINKIILETLPLFGLDGDLATMVAKGRIPITTDVTMHLSPIAMDTPTWKKDLPQNGDIEPGQFPTGFPGKDGEIADLDWPTPPPDAEDEDWWFIGSGLEL